jgi:mannosyltransferase OCH1-like enzyme
MLLLPVATLTRVPSLRITFICYFLVGLLVAFASSLDEPPHHHVMQYELHHHHLHHQRLHRYKSQAPAHLHQHDLDILVPADNPHSQQALSNNVSFLDLPLFPPLLFANSVSSKTNSTSKIPKHVWFTVINATEFGQWENLDEMKKLNPDWTFHVWEDAEIDTFMRNHFWGSKVLWAYENINRETAGASRADIWRYAVMLLIGGVCKYAHNMGMSYLLT